MGNVFFSLWIFEYPDTQRTFSITLDPKHSSFESWINLCTNLTALQGNCDSLVCLCPGEQRLRVQLGSAGPHHPGERLEEEGESSLNRHLLFFCDCNYNPGQQNSYCVRIFGSCLSVWVWVSTVLLRDVNIRAEDTWSAGGGWTSVGLMLCHIYGIKTRALANGNFCLLCSPERFLPLPEKKERPESNDTSWDGNTAHTSPSWQTASSNAHSHL